MTTVLTYSIAGIGALITMKSKKVGGAYCGVLIVYAILKSLTADLITSETVQQFGLLYMTLGTC